eukprot:Gb_40088 [translate_table: standard]
MPNICKLSSSEDGKAPKPIKVLATGIPVRSTNSRSSWLAFRQPPPT